MDAIDSVSPSPNSRYLPGFLTLLNSATRAYGRNVIAYVLLSSAAYLIVRFISIVFLSSANPLENLSLIVLSIILQLFSMLAIIDYARVVEHPSVFRLFITLLKNFFFFLGEVVLSAVIVFGALIILAWTVGFVVEQPFLTMLSDARVGLLTGLASMFILSPLCISAYIAQYERVNPFIALARGMAYDRASGYAILGRFLSLLLFASAVLLVLLFGGELLLLAEIVTDGFIGVIDEIVVILFVPVFVLYGTALYEATHRQIVIAEKPASEIAFIQIFSTIGIFALISFLFSL
ncbi:MAG: hypothetical protein Q8Q18_01345 [bacterium]|nr:hypothetical protein [bacterium]